MRPKERREESVAWAAEISIIRSGAAVASRQFLGQKIIREERLRSKDLNQSFAGQGPVPDPVRTTYSALCAAVIFL